MRTQAQIQAERDKLTMRIDQLVRNGAKQNAAQHLRHLHSRRNTLDWVLEGNTEMYPRPDGILNVTPEEVEDARQATEDVELVRADGTLTHAGIIYVSDMRRFLADSSGVR